MEHEQPARVGRRLAAIVAADVAGYSRLMGLDEVGTARTLREHRAVTDALVAKHGGRLVKTTGDGVLLEFPSVVDAVECAVAVQAVMAQRNEGVPVDRRMLFRIGINLGDILIEGDDILGDGVNIAARLEGIAEPGGICISSSAYDQVRGKVAVEFTDLGEQSLKNIALPVRAYAVASNVLGPAGSCRMDAQQQISAPRLSIVVLPFANIGGDPEQEYFVDGVTESLTTDLSRINGAFVIARNTAFTFKGKAVDVKKLGRELNVRYVLEGAVQRGGNRLRLNVQLIDAETGNHLWAERFDKPIADLFDMQDEIVSSLANTLDAATHRCGGASGEAFNYIPMRWTCISKAGKSVTRGRPRNTWRKRAAFSNVPWYLIPAVSTHWSVARLLIFAASQARSVTTGLHVSLQPKRRRSRRCRSHRTMPGLTLSWAWPTPFRTELLVASPNASGR